MASLAKIEQAHKILSEYKGTNPFIIKVKNIVLAYRLRTANDFEIEYILANYNKEPKLLNKIVKVADWFGEKKKEEWNIEFIPKKLKITWLLGETDNLYHFYCIYRQTQTQAVEVFATKKAILTDLSDNSWKEMSIDFNKYNKMSGKTLYPHQEEGIRFLVGKKKAILAHGMGLGKSITAIVASMVDSYKKILVICPASLKENWKREISLFNDEKDITIVEGHNWDDNKYTIINYDILKNFYTVPTEKVKRKELNLDENGNIFQAVKEKEVVSKKKNIISEAMKDSQLFTSKFDLVIIDEAHRLSNTSSGMFKIVSDLVSRSKPKGIYALSGTPITSMPINFYNILKIIGAPIANDWRYYVERYCDGKTFFNKKERAAYTKMFFGMKKRNSWNELTYSEQSEYYDFLEKRCKKVWVTNGSSHLDELQEVVKPYYLRRVKEELGTLPIKTVVEKKYDLTSEEQKEYDTLWDKFVKARGGNTDSIEKFKKLTEGIVCRQWLSNTMTSRTIELTKKLVEEGHKVVIFCAFDKELYTIQEAFKGICVIHNGKLNGTEKQKAVDSFQNDPNVKVFVGNIQSAGVGITLISGDVAIFNSMDYVPGNNQQCEDRIYRIGQQKDVTIYYQLFNNTYMERINEIVDTKNEVINQVIIKEADK